MRASQQVWSVLLAGLLKATQADDLGTQLYLESRQVVETAADDFSKAAGLPPLRRADPPQIRIWHKVAMFPVVSGFIVTTARVRRYESAPPSVTLPVTRVHLTHMRGGPPYSAFLPSLQELPPYSGLMLNCGTADGASVLIDFILDGERYVVSADNPEVCGDSGAHAIAAIFERLRSSVEKPP